MTAPRLISILVLLLVAVLPSLGQPGGGGDPGGGQPVPFSGLEWLLASGAVLGASTLYRRKKTRE